MPKTTKTTAKKAPAKKPAKKANAAFMEKKNLSPELEAIVGKGPMPRTDITAKLWVYIKKHDLQDPKNKRNIIADENLKKVFGKKSADMFEMTKLVSAHIK